MTIASEFIDMAKEMLNDPEIGFSGLLIQHVVTENPDKPWEPTGNDISYPLRLFYTEGSKNTVNGSIVLKGEKVFICYEPTGIKLEECVGYVFIDHNSKRWVVNSVEAIGAGDRAIVCYVKIGA